MDLQDSARCFGRRDALGLPPSRCADRFLIPTVRPGQCEDLVEATQRQTADGPGVVEAARRAPDLTGATLGGGPQPGSASRIEQGWANWIVSTDCVLDEHDMGVDAAQSVPQGVDLTCVLERAVELCRPALDARSQVLEV